MPSISFFLALYSIIYPLLLISIYNPYQEHETCQIADEEEETEEIRLLRLKGRAIESMYYQD